MPSLWKGDMKQFRKPTDTESRSCDFSCPDVPISSADKAVMRGKLSIGVGICFNKDI